MGFFFLCSTILFSLTPIVFSVCTAFGFFFLSSKTYFAGSWTGCHVMSSGYCLACNDGFTVTTDGNSMCWLNNCQTCADSEGYCTLCNSGYYVYQGKCYNPCPSKTVISGSICADCPSNCDACSDANTCTACSSGYQLYQGQCYSPCPTTTFSASTTTCQDCPSNCDTCSDGSTCTVCSSGYYLYNSVCYDPCPTTTYAVSSSACADCPNNCDVCSDENTCTSCSSSYYLYQSQCLSSCPVTTYTLGTDCLDCSSYCDTCTDGNTCTVCTSGYYFYQNECYVKCPSKAPFLSPTVVPYVCYKTCPAATPYSYQNLCYTSCPVEAPYLYGNVCYSTSTVAKATKISNMAGSIASTILIARSVASFSDPSLYMFGSLMKLLEYTRYMNISHSDSLEILFQTISDSEDFIPMPSMSDEMQSAFENHSLPDVFARYDLPSNFMLNEGDDILAELTILGVFVIAWLLYQGVFYLRNVENIRAFVKNFRFFFQNYVIGKFYEMLGDMAFAAVFEFKTLDMSERYSWASLAACISCVTLGAMLYLINFWVIYVFQKKKKKSSHYQILEKFSEQYKGIGVLFDSFGDESFVHQAVLIFFVARCIISSQVIALAYVMPLFQSATLLILSFFMVIYYLLLRPMKSRLEFTEQLSYEILLFTVNACFFIQATFDSMQWSTKIVVKSIGQVVIVLNIAFKFVPFIFLAIQFCFIGKKYYKLLKLAFKSEETAKKKRVPKQVRHESLNETLGGQTNLTIYQNTTMHQISITQLDSLRKNQRRVIKSSRNGLLDFQSSKKSRSKPRPLETKVFPINRNTSPSEVQIRELTGREVSTKRTFEIRRKEQKAEIQRAIQINKRIKGASILEDF